MVIWATYQRKLSTAFELWKTDRRGFLRAFTGRLAEFIVYSERPSNIPPPEMPLGTEFRQPTESEIVEFARLGDTLEHQLRYLKCLGPDKAFGVFLNGELASICWLITEAEDRKLQVRRVKLRRGEAEIAACFTLPKFRGLGLYTLAIQNACRIALQQGITRIYMITGSRNTPSRRGIEKSGFRRSGILLDFRSWFFPRGQRLILRFFRWMAHQS